MFPTLGIAVPAPKGGLHLRDHGNGEYSLVAVDAEGNVLGNSAFIFRDHGDGWETVAGYLDTGASPWKLDVDNKPVVVR